MRTIDRAARFKRDYKREKKGQLGSKPDAETLQLVRLGSHSEIGF